MRLPRHLPWLVLAAVLTVVASTLELLFMRETGQSSLLRPAAAILFVIALGLGLPGLLVSIGAVIGGYVLAVEYGIPLRIAKPIGVLAVSGIFAGTVAQAWVQGWLYRKFDRHAPLRWHRLWACVIVVPLGSLIAPTTSTLLLDLEGAILNLPPARLWLVGYAGTMLSVLLVAPLAWSMDRQVRQLSDWREQLPLTALLGGLVIAAWVATWTLQSASIGVERSRFDHRVGEVAEEIEHQASKLSMIVAGLQVGFQNAPLAGQRLERLGRDLQERLPTIEAVLLLRRVAPDEQPAFEREIAPAAAAPVRRIHRLVPPRAPGQAPLLRPITLARTELVVERAAPAAAEALWAGLALTTEPEAADLLRRLGTVAPSGSLAPLVLSAHENRLAWVVPLPESGAGAPGALVIIERPELLVRESVQATGGLAEGGGLVLHDITTATPRVIYHGDPDGHWLTLEQAYAVRPNGTLRAQRELRVVDRRWRLEILLPTNSAFSFSSSWWVSQTLIQLLGLLLGFVTLVAYGRRQAMRDMEAQIEVLSRRYLEFEPTRLAEPPSRPMVSALSLDLELTRRDALFEAAFRRREFRQHYEPVIHLASGRILGFESLLRWPQASEPFTPAQIIDWAERSGVIHELTFDALREAVELVELWGASTSAAESVPWISLNVSPDDVAKPSFIADILDLFRRHPMARNRIKLEITEGVLVRDFKGVAQRLRSMRSEGIGIALDDFGTGYSSLSYLHRLPVDSIKIDRSFVTSLSSESRGRDIVQATVELGQRLRIEVLAEGVEDLHTVGLLRRYGCHAAQGFLFSRARPAPVIDEWVRTQRRFEIA